jgi:hypothetical protein
MRIDLESDYFLQLTIYPDSTSPDQEMTGIRRKNGRFGAKRVILSLFSGIFEAEKTFLSCRKEK